MTPLERLQLDFTAADLGVADADLVERLTAYVTLATGQLPEDATDERVYQAALSFALASQIRVLLRKVEEFEAPGELKLKQGLQARIKELRADQRKAERLAGLVTALGPVSIRPASLPSRRSANVRPDCGNIGASGVCALGTSCECESALPPLWPVE